MTAAFHEKVCSSAAYRERLVYPQKGCDRRLVD
jgi:hypothetical protein